MVANSVNKGIHYKTKSVQIFPGKFLSFLFWTVVYVHFKAKRKKKESLYVTKCKVKEIFKTTVQWTVLR